MTNQVVRFIFRSGKKIFIFRSGKKIFVRQEMELCYTISFSSVFVPACSAPGSRRRLFESMRLQLTTSPGVNAHKLLSPLAGKGQRESNLFSHGGTGFIQRGSTLAAGFPQFDLQPLTGSGFMARSGRIRFIDPWSLLIVCPLP